MGIRKYRGRIVVDKRWPDKTRITRAVSNKTQGKKLLARIEASIADGSWRQLQERLKLRNADRLTLEAYSETYLEEYAKVRNKPKGYKRKRTSLNALCSQLGGLELSAIRPSCVHEYVRRRRADGREPGTINRDLRTLMHLMHHALECGVVTANPIESFPILKEERKEQVRYTEGQIQSVLEAVRSECQPLFIFIRETGCRKEEALSLEHWQIQRDSRSVVFSGNTKSMNYRYVPLTQRGIDALDAVPVLEDCPYVFYNPRTGDRWSDCRKVWDNARKSAGVPDLQIKDLRRHFAIQLAEAGAAMHDIQQVLGHASVQTTEKHYAQFSPQHSAKRILRVLEGGRVEPETTRKQADGSSDQHGSRIAVSI